MSYEDTSSFSSIFNTDQLLNRYLATVCGGTSMKTSALKESKSVSGFGL